MVDVVGDPVIVLSRAELPALNRALLRTVSMYRNAGIIPPRVLFDLAVEVNRLENGSTTELRNTRQAPDTPLSSQPVQTLTVKEAARAMEVSESYVRRLIRERTLDVRDAPGAYEVYADSLAVWREQRERRMECDEGAA